MLHAVEKGELTLSEAKQFAIEVVNQLRAAGYIALWAGGCVRDLLMGNEPHDYDIATSATPQQVRDLFGHRRSLMVGAAFGVVIVRGSSKLQQQVEVATFRTDSSYTDGRRPDRVTFSTPEKDAQRRDFSINGMFFDPVTQEVIDYVGGREDLHAGIIRAIGDPHARLAEDKLRMLRAVRFAARFGFAIESETESAIIAHSAETALVSGERIAIELRKTLETSQAAWAVNKLQSTGLLQVIAPEIAESWAESGTQICRLLDVCDKGGWLARLAAMYLPVASNGREPKLLVSALKKRLKLANDDADALQFALEVQPTFAAAPSLPWSQVQPLLVKEFAAVALALLNARRSIEPELANAFHWLEDRLHWPSEILDPPPLIDGSVLQGAGLSPGPEFRLILEEVRAMQLDGLLPDRNAALAWLATRKSASVCENGKT